jgi:hypothetical protein
MLRARKKQRSTSVARLEARCTQAKDFTIEDVVRLVSISFSGVTVKIDIVEGDNSQKQLILPVISVFLLRLSCTN